MFLHPYAAAKLLEIAVRLVGLTSKQFPRVERVLPESINDAVLTAQGISKTTQVRASHNIVTGKDIGFEEIRARPPNYIQISTKTYCASCMAEVMLLNMNFVSSQSQHCSCAKF